MIELTIDQQQMIVGGVNGFAVFSGTVALAWAAPVAFFCPPAAVAMALGGAGLIGKGTGAY